MPPTPESRDPGQPSELAAVARACSTGACPAYPSPIRPSAAGLRGVPDDRGAGAVDDDDALPEEGAAVALATDRVRESAKR
jgi:hypothetical protein